MASSLVLKNLLVSSLLGRVAIPLRPVVVSGVPIKRFSTSYHDDRESVSLTPQVTKPRSFKREDTESIYLYVDMPGIDEDDVEAVFDPGYTTKGSFLIKGKVCDPEYSTNGALIIKGKALEKDFECECRNYSHWFALPENIKTVGITANMGKGVLKLTLPKVKGINQDQKMINELKIKVSRDYSDDGY